MQKRTVAFSETIKPLAVAATVGLALLIAPYVFRAGRALPYLILEVAVFVYGAAIVLVLPVFGVSSASRRPSYPVAAVWGAGAGLASAALAVPELTELARPVLFVSFGSIGAASGLAYVLMLNDWQARRTRAGRER
jgi:hypothetical protein